jgi:4-amino-4-deoxy-L-arabinose transferase-like glycosyltransferase
LISNSLLFLVSKKIVKKDHLPLIFIIVVAFLVRSWDLGWNGFNGDESIYSGQAASLLGEENFLKQFGVFRAHPLLLQSLVSMAFALFGIHDTVARMVPVIFGTLTVFVTYLVAKELFDRQVGLISCLVLALLPFHIVFSRQVLLDVPLSFFVILFLYFIAKYKRTGDVIYSYWAGVSCGLCFISKEVGIIMLPIFVAYTLITRSLKLNSLFVFLSGFVFGILPFILLVLTRYDFVNAFYYYATFQLSREPTIFSLRYSSILINEAFGYVLSILCIISFLLIWRESRNSKSREYRDQIILLALTLGTLFLFYQLLPSKGDRFMITLIPPAVILGCAFLVTDSVRHWHLHKLVYLVIVPLIILSNNFFLSKAFSIEDLKISDNLGTPWHREAALWIKNNTSVDAGILTADSRLANMIRFYSNHDVYSIEINRNPAYVQADNPALLILNKNVTIIVEDLDPSTSRTPITVELRKYLGFFNPELVHTAFKHNIEAGKDVATPMVKVYQLN